MYELYNPGSANILGYFYNEEDAIEFCRNKKYYKTSYRPCEIFHDGLDIFYETRYR